MVPAKKSRNKGFGGLPLDGSWPFLIAFLFFSSSFELFPHLAPDHSPSFYVFLGILVCFLYLLTVLIHEGGHLIAAKITGFPYEGDVLSIWGGRPKTVNALLASDPRIMVVRMAGSLANLLVGGGITFLLSGGDPVKGELVLFFGKSNLLIAFANMIPVLPFDMGVLFLTRFGMKSAAELTGEEKDFSRGVVFGWILTVGGILLGGRGSFLTGFSFVILGFLLIRSCLSWRERMGLAAHLARNGVTWAITLTTPPLQSDDSLERARTAFGKSARAILPVVGADGILLGKMGWRELRKKPVEAWHLYPVVEMMEPLAPGDTLSLDSSGLSQRVFDLLEAQQGEAWVISQGRFMGEIRPPRLHERYKMDRFLPAAQQRASSESVKKGPADQQTIEESNP